MKTLKWVLVLSISINILLFTFLSMKDKSYNESFSQMSRLIISDLVQLEGVINYQYENNWNTDNVILEKIEDIKKETQYAIETGRKTGVITKQLEQDLNLLLNYLNKFPEYTGYPNTTLDEEERKKLIEMRDSLRQVGWGMNISYTAGWDSFHESLMKLIY